MQLRIQWWEKGLKEHIRSQVTVDSVTYKEYTNIDKAQSAACALGAHLYASSTVAAASGSLIHTHLCDAKSNDDDAKYRDELPVAKHSCTDNRREHCRCCNCGRVGHLAIACPGQNEVQNKEAHAKNHADQPGATESLKAAADGELLMVGNSIGNHWLRGLALLFCSAVCLTIALCLAVCLAHALCLAVCLASLPVIFWLCACVTACLAVCIATLLVILWLCTCVTACLAVCLCHCLLGCVPCSSTNDALAECHCH